MEYTTIFDISQRGIDWFPVFIGAAFIVVGLLVIKSNYSNKEIKPIAILVVMIGVFISISISAFQYGNVLYYRTVLLENQAQIVEGPITNFHPMPKHGHDTERFTVNGILFRYSDYFSTPAFNNTSSHGGPLKEGLFVRIYFTDSKEFPGDEAILRIDMRR